MAARGGGREVLSRFLENGTERDGMSGFPANLITAVRRKSASLLDKFGFGTPGEVKQTRFQDRCISRSANPPCYLCYNDLHDLFKKGGAGTGQESRQNRSENRLYYLPILGILFSSSEDLTADTGSRGLSPWYPSSETSMPDVPFVTERPKSHRAYFDSTFRRSVRRLYRSPWQAFPFAEPVPGSQPSQPDESRRATRG
jgi:hypothetical protein